MSGPVFRQSVERRNRRPGEKTEEPELQKITPLKGATGIEPMPKKDGAACIGKKDKHGKEFRERILEGRKKVV